MVRFFTKIEQRYFLVFYYLVIIEVQTAVLVKPWLSASNFSVDTKGKVHFKTSISFYY